MLISHGAPGAKNSLFYSLKKNSKIRKGLMIKNLDRHLKLKDFFYQSIAYFSNDFWKTGNQFFNN